MGITTDTVTQEIIEELRRLPVNGRRQVLDFVRFLRLQPSDQHDLEMEMDRALASVRAIAAKEGITDAEIDAEIAQTRAGS